MTETFVAHDGVQFRCYRTQTGVDRAFIGCHHATPREAIAHTERKEDTPDARIPADRLRVALVNAGDVPTSRSASHWLTPSSGGVGDYGAEQTRTPGHRLTAVGPRRPAPTDLVPPGPVGAPSPELRSGSQSGRTEIPAGMRLLENADATEGPDHSGPSPHRHLTQADPSRR